MSIQRILPTVSTQGATVDTWVTAFQKADANFLEIYKRLTTQTVNATVGGTTTWDVSLGGYLKLVQGAGNTTLASPTNMFDGGSLVVEVVQDGVGSRLVTWGSLFVWTAATAPTLTTTANKRDLIFFTCANGVAYGGQTILNLA